MSKIAVEREVASFNWQFVNNHLTIELKERRIVLFVYLVASKVTKTPQIEKNKLWRGFHSRSARGMRRLRPTVHLRRQLERQLDPAGMFPPSDRLEWDATLNAPIPPECACQVPPVGLGLWKKKNRRVKWPVSGACCAWKKLCSLADQDDTMFRQREWPAAAERGGRRRPLRDNRRPLHLKPLIFFLKKKINKLTLLLLCVFRHLHCYKVANK